jgi:arylformamidase
LAAALTPEEVERGYNNRAAVPDHPRWLAHYPRASAEARAALAPKVDLRYGRGPKETLDLFLPAGRARGTFVFWHGGYWRAFDKSDFLFRGAALRGAGPRGRRRELRPLPRRVDRDDRRREPARDRVARARRCGTWRGPREHRRGGHSAGGHIVAMLFTTDWAKYGISGDPISAGLFASGVHDLAPMVQYSFNADFKLDDAEAARLSPSKLSPRSRAPLVLAAGRRRDFRIHPANPQSLGRLAAKPAAGARSRRC